MEQRTHVEEGRGEEKESVRILQSLIQICTSGVWGGKMWSLLTFVLPCPKTSFFSSLSPRFLSLSYFQKKGKKKNISSTQCLIDNGHIHGLRVNINYSNNKDQISPRIGFSSYGFGLYKHEVYLVLHNQPFVQLESLHLHPPPPTPHPLRNPQLSVF